MTHFCWTISIIDIVIFFFNARSNSRFCLHLKNDRFKIFSSHILACLSIFDECDRVSSTLTRDIVEAHDCVKLFKDICTLKNNFERYVSTKSILLSLFCFSVRSSMNVNALNLTCRFDNANVVRAILNAIKLLSFKILNEMLRFNTSSYSFSLFITIQHENAIIAFIFLEIDKQSVNENVKTKNSKDFFFTYISSQWNLKHKNYFKYDTIFMIIVNVFKEKKMLSLLKIARSKNINTKYENDEIFLHYVVKNEKYVLTRALIQIYDVDKTITNMNEKTSFELEIRDEDSILDENSWAFELLKFWMCLSLVNDCFHLWSSFVCLSSNHFWLSILSYRLLEEFL